MFRQLAATRQDVVPLVLRLALGIVMFPHGAQKVFGWFGGYGVSGTLGFFGNLGIPAWLGLLAIAAEFLGSLGLVTGFLTRLAAFGVAADMVGAVIKGGHLANGFFMNWFGNQKGEGFEYHLLAIGMAIALMIRGGGTASIDRALTRS